MDQVATCPSCKGSLMKFPGRKTKCPNCGKYIYVRTDPKRRAKILLTDRQAHIHDWRKRLQEEYGFSEETYEKVRAKNLEKTEEQTILALLEARAKRPRISNFESAASTYYTMACFVQENGDDPTEYLRLSAHANLMEFKDVGTETVEILANSDSCPECLAMKGKTYSVEDALREMPLPNRACTKILPENKHPMCRCTWVIGEVQ